MDATTLIASAIIIGLLFILSRPIMLWYYKVDKSINIQLEIRDELIKLNSKNKQENPK